MPLFLANCASLSFYTQAVRGQAEITLKKRKISKLLEDPETDPKLAAKLRLAEKMVDFAESDLSLPSKGSYRYYTDLKRKHVVHIVYGSPEFSLEPKTWWYPVVGSQDYRGYFAKKDAEREVEKLKAQGLDTFTGGVNAYSTLGFFKDPILNTFIDYPEVDLAELIFHELTHHRYYAKKETSFNEALAEVVAREGTRRWLTQKGDLDALRNYELRLGRRSQIRTAIEETIARLKTLYAMKQLTPEEMGRRKEEEFARLREEIKVLFRGWKQKSTNFLSTPLNNARLNAFTTYEELVPPLRKILAKHDGNIESFLKEVEKKGPSILDEVN